MNGTEEITTLPAPRITAVLNCYAPGGANRGQAVIRADGTVQFYGEETLLKPHLAALRSVDLRRFGNRRRLAAAN
jgi:hypothetical protein